MDLCAIQRIIKTEKSGKKVGSEFKRFGFQFILLSLKNSVTWTNKLSLNFLFGKMDYSNAYFVNLLGGVR